MDMRPPTIRYGTWYPGESEELAGTLLAVRGVRYEFAERTVFPLLTMGLDDGQEVEVHGFPWRLCHKLMAHQPEIGKRLVLRTQCTDQDGYLYYQVNPESPARSAWLPLTASETCQFAARPNAEKPFRTPDVAIEALSHVPDEAVVEALLRVDTDTDQAEIFRRELAFRTVYRVLADNPDLAAKAEKLTAGHLLADTGEVFPAPDVADAPLPAPGGFLQGMPAPGGFLQGIGLAIQEATPGITTSAPEEVTER